MLTVASRFCDGCGCKLIFEKRMVGYETETGDEIYTVSGKCPNKKWYNLHAAGTVRINHYSYIPRNFVGNDDVKFFYGEI